ncbi:MAG: iron-sulfur cluster biosynthesis family protein [Thermoanaerobaculia bacterium]|nr:iron-sulfur cluster biosynthesis family protein [Thermoanaerobaculia bacterium]
MEIRLTPAARDAVRSEIGPDQVVRIAFAGGCGALGFSLSTPRRGNADDLAVEAAGVTLYLDRQAVAELDGATLDYHPDEGFVLDHPAWGVSC